jgi:hypothetical protein
MLGHKGPAIIQRPSSSVRWRPLAGSADAENSKDQPEPGSARGRARDEQSFNLLKPEAVIARPLVDLDPRHAHVA